MNPWLPTEDLVAEIGAWFSDFDDYERIKWEVVEGRGIVEEVESLLKEFYGMRHAILCNCGTNALLTLALACESEDRPILTVSNSPWTTAPFSLAGVTLHPVNLAPDEVADSSAFTDAIETLDLYAVLVADSVNALHDTVKFREVCRAHGVSYWADAAKSFGRRLDNGILASSLADAIVLSFGPGKGKHWVGEIGVLLCNDSELFRSAIRLSQHPSRYGRDVSLEDVPAAVGIKATPCPFSVVSLRCFLRNYLPTQS